MANRLALWAKVGAASTHLDALYRRAANIARLTRPAEDLHMELMPSFAASAVDIVAKGGAAILQGIAQDVADGAVEPPVFGFV